MHLVKCWFLSSTILYLSFHIINATTVVINNENEEKPAGLLEPCIEPLCSEFSGKVQQNQTCVPGRCECPEERQFCTNRDSTRVIPKRKSKSAPSSDEEMPEDYDVNEEVKRVLESWEPSIKDLSLATIYSLTISTILIIIHGTPQALQNYCIYVFALNLSLLLMCSLVLRGYYDKLGEITVYVLIPCLLFGFLYYGVTAGNRYVMPYILNFFSDDNNIDETRNEEAENENDSNISASSIQTLPSTPPESVRSRKKKGKKRRR